VGEPFTVAEVEGPMAAALAECDWAILGAQSAADFPPETIAALRAAGLSVCLDAQGLARGARPGPVRLRPFAPDQVDGVQVLKLNVAEAEAFETLDELRRVVPEIVVTAGAQGATVLTGSGAGRIAGSGRPFDDPTGAGDSFLASYVLSRQRGLEPAPAGARAVALVERLYGG
jgi:sugar/nucleoside kinase (ribokinase family)